MAEGTAEILNSSAKNLPDGVRQFPNVMGNTRRGNTLLHDLYPNITRSQKQHTI